MKKILITAFIAVLCLSCGGKKQKQKMEEKLVNAKDEDCLPKRYELCDENYNYFKLKEDLIKLRIPVTDNNLHFKSMQIIPDVSINAILVHLKGGEDCTPDDPLVNFIPLEDRISNLGLDVSRLGSHDSLLVVVFNNTEPPERNDIMYIRSLIDSSRSYKEAKQKINNIVCLKEFDQSSGDKTPKEHGGDVIGGNQK